MQKRRYLWTAAVTGTFLSLTAATNLTYAAEPTQAQLTQWARQAVSTNKKEANAAIVALRTAGPVSIQAMHNAYVHRKDAPMARAFEEVGMQHDNWASQLYWYTDLEKAKDQAKKENKPILSLRLLGNLNEELSCANSRFFRTALYPNAQVSQTLRRFFILHWQSVRPAPKVTIDFGDGRKIQTTITGNSIHYILDSRGRVVDALPGLYSASAFLQWLVNAGVAAKTSVNYEGAPRAAFLKNFHTKAIEDITRKWQVDIGQVRVYEGAPRIVANAVQRPRQANNLAQYGKADGSDNPFATPLPKLVAAPDEVLMDVPPPTARDAAPVALSKIRIEAAPLKQITVAVPRDRNALQTKTDDAMWAKIALMHWKESMLDAESLAVLKTKTPRADVDKVSWNFEKSIAEDTVRNEYGRHVTLHEWLIANPDMPLDAFNKKVYAEMFLTPDSDPWLGLLPTEAYTGVTNDGVTRANP